MRILTITIVLCDDNGNESEITYREHKWKASDGIYPRHISLMNMINEFIRQEKNRDEKK